ncbi:hypothetical protein RH831_10775 [Halodesulfurarchaeum sp. HSR-GB]|uniref:hypothetical protein n=1 Tax=Halodesulfurarchaeum sp. HSR-GB TaxID=3074077 RepID=UPI00285D2959|nr:hypothetical protein [Halodesulfurarchaeum sp. HSR-GB]MDR5657659.1 hypothetical protein [Halodesulfurarchaeum sp. HSR-GB]
MQAETTPHTNDIDELADIGLAKLGQGNLDQVESILREIRDLSKPPQSKRTFLRVDGFNPDEFEHDDESDQAGYLADQVFSIMQEDLGMDPKGVVPIVNPETVVIEVPKNRD